MAEQNKDQIDQYIQKIKKCVDSYTDEQQTLLLNYALRCKQLASDYFINSQMDLIIGEIQQLKQQQQQPTTQVPVQKPLATQPVQQLNKTDKLSVKDLIRTKVNSSQINIPKSNQSHIIQNKIIQQNDAFIKDAEDQILKIYQGQKQTEINELNSKIQLLTDQQRQLTDQVQQKDQLINQFQIKLDQKTQENALLLQQIEKLQKQVEQIQGQFYNVSQMCQQLQEQIFKQQEQNNQLQMENSMNNSNNQQQTLTQMTQAQNNNCVQIINILTSLLQPIQFDKLTKQVIDEAVQSLTQIKEIRDVLLQSIQLSENSLRQQLNQVSFQSAAQKFLQIIQFIKELDLEVNNNETIELFGQTVLAYVAQIALNVLVNLM